MCPSPILKVKVMHVSTANIFEIVTVMATTTIAVKEETTYWFSIGIFTYDLVTDKVVHISTVDNLENGER